MVILLQKQGRCILFSVYIICTVKTSGYFCNFDGFKNWKCLNPLIQFHENSSQHIQNFTKWKIFDKGLRNGGLIDDSIQTALKYEVNKCKQIFKNCVEMYNILCRK